MSGRVRRGAAFKTVMKRSAEETVLQCRSSTSVRPRGCRGQARGHCGKERRKDRERYDASIQLDAPPNRDVGRDIDGRLPGPEVVWM